MRHFTTEGIVLRVFAQGDIHKRLLLLTKDKGLIHATAFGAFKEKSRLRGASDFLIYSRLSLYYNPVKDLYKIEDIHVSCDYEIIKTDLNRLYTAMLWAELTYKTHGGGEAAKIFLLLKDFLYYLDSSDLSSLDTLRVQFLIKFLAVSGFLFCIHNCNACGKVLEKETAFFVHNEEAVYCRSCSTGKSFLLNPAMIYYINKVINTAVKESLRVQLSGENLLLLKEMLYTWLLGITEQKLNTLDKGRAFL